MPNLSVRDLGSVGIISDVHPYDLPPNALSRGVNVRFENKKVTRGPVFRRLYQYPDAVDNPGLDPGYVFTSAGGGIVAVAQDFSSILEYSGGSTVDLTPTSTPSGAAGNPFSHTTLGNIDYLNSETDVPYYKDQSSSQFQTLTNWNSGWRCRSLRSYKDFLVALNVTKSGVSYPQMVKWSDVAAFGSIPTSWDETSTTNSAGETIFNDMKGVIVDGCQLRDTFFIYGDTEVWAMNYTGTSFIFDFRKKFDNVGIINQNCVVEVDGLHYIFGKDDIYAHDGVSIKSIIHGQDKDFVFQGLMDDFSYLCFVTHNPYLNEIYFCYPSEDSLVGFQNPSTGCNRLAVFNYRLGIWSFYDAPNVTGATLAPVATGVSYDSTDPLTFESIGGTFSDGSDSALQHIFVCVKDTSLGITGSRIYGLDLLSGSRISAEADLEVLKDAFIERIGIDLDDLGLPLTTYKCIHELYPQLALTVGETGVYFQLGASDIVGSDPVWASEQLYDPSYDNKVDAREAGRYLAYRLRCSGVQDFALSGFDCRVTARGRR